MLPAVPIDIPISSQKGRRKTAIWVLTKTQRRRVGARAPGSREPCLNLIRMGAPECQPSSLRCRLVKLDHAGEAGTTHIDLWEPRAW